MKEFFDQLGRKVVLEGKPSRIVSLVPSQTELLFDLDLADRIAGITKFCVHPEELVSNYAKVGGTKNVNIEKIINLNPDLIIANKEENTKEDIAALECHFPVWVSDVATLNDALTMILSIGELTVTSDKAKELARNIEGSFTKFKTVGHSKRALYFIWNNPLMVAGQDTFISAMMNIAGFQNIVEKSRYPELNKQQIQQLNPEVILLSSEPYPFKEKHIKEFQELCPQAQVKIVDGEMFSWYGSRMQYAPEYFEKLQQSLSEGNS